MSGLVPRGAEGALPEPEHPSLLQRRVGASERRASWEVAAARWRACELAEAVFGRVAASALVGTRARGVLRGLLRLQVPFTGLVDHREREARFLAAVEADPVLAVVPLVYVFGPEPD
jgi:hypothetical protein